MMEKVAKSKNFERAKTEEVKMAEENVLSLTVEQDIKPTSSPSAFAPGIVAEKQNNLAQYLDSTVASSDENGSVQSSETEFVAPDGGWGWFIVLASFLIHFIG